MDFKEEREMRRKFLRRLFDLRREKPNEYPSKNTIGKELGLSKEETDTITDSLGCAGEIKIMSRGGSMNITQLGINQVEEDLLKSNEVDPKKVFVVHGRNEKARRALFEFLRSIGLDPIEWNQAIKSTGKAAPFIGEVLDKAFEVAQAIIVLITGDDIAKLKSQYIKADDPNYEKEFTHQARPNVIFEAGLAFGRCSDRTVIVVLEKEKTRPFSDIYGRHLVKLSNKTESRMDIISRLQTAGCEIDIEGKTDWMSTGDFEGVIDRNFTNLAQDELPEQEHKKSDKVTILTNCINRGKSLLTNFSLEDYKNWEISAKIVLSRHFGNDSEIYKDFINTTSSQPHYYVHSGKKERKKYLYSKAENQIYKLETHLEFIK